LKISRCIATTSSGSRAISPSKASGHLIKGSGNGEYYLLRGSYANHMLRTADGWRIERIIQHRSWEYGNKNAVTEAIARSAAQASA